jgi:peptide/nickel transport system substrate-binding protein
MHLATVRAAARRVLRAPAALPVAGALLAAACAGLGLTAPAFAATSASPSPSAQPLTAHFGTTSDADDLNPFLARSGTSYEILHLNYDFLVGYDTDLSPRPELATSWEVSPDGKVWTFHLRRGVKWQDGVPFTAGDVAFTFNYIADNDLTAFTGYTDGIERAVVVDADTVELRCTRPKADMLRLGVPILPQHVWGRIPGDRAGTDYVVKPPLVGTGPFQTVEARKGRSITLVKNPEYWLTGKPHIDELVIHVYRDAGAMVQDLRSGALDYAQGIPVARFRALQSVPELHTNAADLRYFDGIVFNCYDSPDSLGHPALRDPAFRAALAWAVDKVRIVDLSHGGYALPGQGLVTPDVPTYSWRPPAARQAGFDLLEASRRLEEAGYPLTGGVRRDRDGAPVTLRLWTRADDAAGQSTGGLVAGWFKSLGLGIRLETLDPGAISDALHNERDGRYAPDFDMYVSGRGESVDPDFILSVFTTGQIGGRNDACWSSEEYDRLYLRQARTIDPEARKPLVDRMSAIFYREAPLIVTDYGQQLEAYNIVEWEGWTQAPPGSGPVAFVNDNIDTYLALRPKPAPEPKGEGGVGTGVYVGIALAVLVTAVATVLLLRRGRGRALGALSLRRRPAQPGRRRHTDSGARAAHLRPRRRRGGPAPGRGRRARAPTRGCP